MTVAVRGAYSVKQTGTGATGSTVTVADSTVDTGRYRKYFRVAARNLTNNYDRLTFVIQSGATDYVVSEQRSLSDVAVYFDPDPVLVSEGYNYAVKFVGTVTDDELEVFFHYLDGPAGDLAV